MTDTYRVMANTSGGFRGRVSTVCKSDGKPLTGLTEQRARELAESYNASRSPYGPALIWYTVERDK